MFISSSVVDTCIYFLAKNFEIASVTLRVILEAVVLPMPISIATYLNFPSSDKVEAPCFSTNTGLLNHLACFSIYGRNFPHKMQNECFDIPKFSLHSSGIIPPSGKSFHHFQFRCGFTQEEWGECLLPFSKFCVFSQSS